MKTLDVGGIGKVFGALRAVDAVSVSLAEGEVCGLVGPNGSGKSTFLNLVSGVLTPSFGTVTIQGREMTGKPAHKFAAVGLSRTFQLIRLIPGATVVENVLAGLYRESPDRNVLSALLPFTHRDRRRALAARTREALERLELDAIADAPVGDLPFGVQRRVELARAIVAKPDILLLDEPAAGITDNDRQTLVTLIADEAARGCAVILVDHHMDFMIDVCPRLIVMNFGQLIFDGGCSEAIEDPRVREAYIGA